MDRLQFTDVCDQRLRRFDLRCCRRHVAEPAKLFFVHDDGPVGLDHIGVQIMQFADRRSEGFCLLDKLLSVADLVVRRQHFRATLHLLAGLHQFVIQAGQFRKLCGLRIRLGNQLLRLCQFVIRLQLLLYQFDLLARLNDVFSGLPELCDLSFEFDGSIDENGGQIHLALEPREIVVGGDSLIEILDPFDRTIDIFGEVGKLSLLLFDRGIDVMNASKSSNSSRSSSSRLREQEVSVKLIGEVERTFHAGCQFNTRHLMGVSHINRHVSAESLKLLLRASGIADDISSCVRVSPCSRNRRSVAETHSDRSSGLTMANKLRPLRLVIKHPT
ncbi:hypothetical protein D3C76_759380 [compost metagenome]